MMISIVLSTVYLLTNIASSSTIYYVNPSNGVSGDGESWSTAFISLEEALFAATSSDSIWLVGDTTYTPSTTSRSSCFVAAKGVSIFGGFSGTEASAVERLPSTASSILSGDINVNGDQTDNCYHVLTYTESLFLDSLEISDGFANNQMYEDQTEVLGKYGGALITSSFTRSTLNLYINNVVFRNNMAINGGALFFGAGGGGTTVNVNIHDSEFINNKAIKGQYEGGYGGAIHTFSAAKVYAFDTKFTENNAEHRGGAVYQDYGAGFECTGCTFTANSAGHGGAIFSEDRNSQTAGTFPVVKDCIFVDNNATVYGGAICWFNGVHGTVNGSIFRRNIAELNGSVIARIGNGEITLSDNQYVNNGLDAVGASDYYDEAAFEYDAIDPTITWDIPTELALLANNEEARNEADVFPWNEAWDPTSIVCYVDVENTYSTPDGTSWTTAYNDLQSCLDGDRDEIWVKTGSYVPSQIPAWKDTTKTSARSFSMTAKKRMYGGFDGTETSRSQRDFVANPTYLNGKINGITFVKELVIAEDDTIVDGFVFINAGSESDSNIRRRLQYSTSIAGVFQKSTGGSSGGGVFSNSTNITVANSIFYKLFTGSKGGAVYCIGQEGWDESDTKSPSFINVAFLGNRANARGGAISADVGCHFECNYCKFEKNSCALKGGAIYLDFSCDPIITNSKFIENIALESGGCIAADGASYVEFSNTTFIGNTAKWEGACLYSGSGVGPKIEQGFIFTTDLNPKFEGNEIISPGMGMGDIYGWPFTVVQFGSKSPTTSPTPSPTASIPLITFPEDYNVAKPNVLIFYLDDMFYTASMSESYVTGTMLNGANITYSDIATPNIDRIKNEGVAFPRAYAGGPKCAPSRYSILTGKYPTRSRWARFKTMATSDGKAGTNVTITTTKLGFEDKIYNLPNTLKTVGNYYTGMVGKWHIMTSNDDGHNYGCSSLYTAPNAQLYKNCTDLVKEVGFDYVDAWYHGNIADTNIQDDYGHNPEWMLAKSEEMIDNAVQNNQPFFLYFSTTVPHTPNAIPSLQDNTGYIHTPKGDLTGDEIPMNTGMRSRTSILSQAYSLAATASGRSSEERIAAYTWIDETLGTLIDYLDVNGLYDNTFFVVTNDHGMPAKGMMYEHGSRVFQYVRYPPLFGTAGHVLNDDFIVSNVDLAATVFDAADILHQIDTVYEQELDSISWLNDVISDINSGNSNPSCCQQRYIDIHNSHAIVTKRYKYIFRATLDIETNHDTYLQYENALDYEQIYNFNQDPNEQINRINANGLKDDIFNFRVQMIDYILDIACNATTGCIIPAVDYIPADSTWSQPTTMPSPPPTPSPTFVADYTCDNSVSYQRSWSGANRFDPNKQTNVDTKLGQAVDSCILRDCGTDCAYSSSWEQLEFDYKFELDTAADILDIDMTICCNPGKTFGSTPPLTDYTRHYVGTTHVGNYDGFPIRDETIRNIVVYSALTLVIFCFCIGFCLLYRRHKNKHATQLEKHGDLGKKKQDKSKKTNRVEMVEPLTPIPTQHSSRNKLTLQHGPPSFSSYNADELMPRSQSLRNPRVSVPSMSRSSMVARSSSNVHSMKNRVLVARRLPVNPNSMARSSSADGGGEHVLVVARSPDVMSSPDVLVTPDALEPPLFSALTPDATDDTYQRSESCPNRGVRLPNPYKGTIGRTPVAKPSRHAMQISDRVDTMTETLEIEDYDGDDYVEDVGSFPDIPQ